MTERAEALADHITMLIADKEALQARLQRAEEALRTVERRIEQYDDMDDATLLAWISDEVRRYFSEAPTADREEA